MTNFNEQFGAATRQFADQAAQINRLALENAEKLFGLQLATLEQNAQATFAFLGEVAEVRDLDAAKTVWPKGVQVARENFERSVSAGQEVFGRTVKTQEAITQLAKSNFETATAKAQAQAEQVVKATTKAGRR